MKGGHALKDHNTYIIEKSEDGMKLEGYLRNKLRLSHRTLVKLKKNQSIKLNGEKSRINVLLSEGDKLEITLYGEESENILPEPMELDIVYEDEYLIAVNKPYNMPVHPTRRHIMGTLANGIVYYWMNRERSTVVRLVNRLDKDTSGLVVIAKNSHIQHLLSLNIGKPEFEKKYIAVVEGIPDNTVGTIDLPIARERAGFIKRVVREDGDRAVTHYEVLSSFKSTCVLSIKLETGRTHQIRVHMSHIGHPLLGDELYGGSTKLIYRHALHANEINMKHPITGKWLKLKAEMPSDMVELIEALKFQE